MHQSMPADSMDVARPGYTSHRLHSHKTTDGVPTGGGGETGRGGGGGGGGEGEAGLLPAWNQNLCRSSGPEDVQVSWRRNLPNVKEGLLC